MEFPHTLGSTLPPSQAPLRGVHQLASGAGVIFREPKWGFSGDAREITWEWMREYKGERTHDALGKVPPAVFRETMEAKNSTLKQSA